MTKPTWLKILMGIGVGASATVGALAAGLLPAVLTGVSAAVAAIAALYHASPALPPKEPPP